MERLIIYIHSLAIAVLIGKIVLLSFVVAPILAKQLEREPFGKVVRRLFPAYYALGMGTASAGFLASAALLTVRGGRASLWLTGGLWLLVLAAEAYCRSLLTPQSNELQDRLKEQDARGTIDPLLQRRWNRLHRRSVALNSLVLGAGLCLLGLASRL